MGKNEILSGNIRVNGIEVVFGSNPVAMFVFLQILDRMKRYNKESCLDVCLKYCSKESPPDQIVFFANYILAYLEPLLSDSDCATLHARLIGFKVCVIHISQVS